MSNNYSRFVAMWRIIGHATYELNMIKCCLCPREFSGWSQDQAGDMCAWTRHEGARWSIHCGYGSSYDMSEFWYINNYPTEHLPRICDYCITDMLRDGTIIDSGNELDP